MHMVTTYANLVVKKKGEKKRKEELYPLALALTLALCPWLCSHFVHEKEPKLQAEICQQQQHRETLWVRVCGLSLPKPGITTITAHKQ